MPRRVFTPIRVRVVGYNYFQRAQRLMVVVLPGSFREKQNL